MDINRMRALDMWMQGYSVPTIARILGRDPSAVWRWLRRGGSGSHQMAESRLAQAEAVVWQRAWQWTDEVDRLRDEISRTPPDDPRLPELQRQYSLAMAAYRDWWDRYMLLRRLRTGQRAEEAPQVTVDARQQVIVVGAEEFYRRLHELRRALAGGAQEREGSLQEWLERHAEIHEPTERL